MTVPAGEQKKKSPMMPCLIIGGVVGCLGLGVIVILGVVVGSGAKNFNKYGCKAKQSEAKVNLNGLYISEKAFFGEYNFYTSDLVSLAWTPYDAPSYLYGFAYAGPEDLRRDDSKPEGYDDERSHTLQEGVLSSSYQTNKMVDQSGGKLTSEDLPEDSWVEKSRFKAAAVGDLKDDGGGRLDIWTIDDQKNLSNVQDDCL